MGTEGGAARAVGFPAHDGFGVKRARLRQSGLGLGLGLVNYPAGGAASVPKRDLTSPPPRALRSKVIHEPEPEPEPALA